MALWLRSPSGCGRCVLLPGGVAAWLLSHFQAPQRGAQLLLLPDSHRREAGAVRQRQREAALPTCYRPIVRASQQAFGGPLHVQSPHRCARNQRCCRQAQESDLARLHNDAIKNDPFISAALGPNPKVGRPTRTQSHRHHTPVDSSGPKEARDVCLAFACAHCRYVMTVNPAISSGPASLGDNRKRCPSADGAYEGSSAAAGQPGAEDVL